ncbi:MAG: 2-enoyl thioester reductase domain-containing protein [Verrucomicrobiota bacterium]
MSSNSFTRVIRFQDFGPPQQVLQCRSEPTPPPPKPDQILVKILCAPINPADLNFAEGTYGKKPALPATPGNEAVGRVIAIGDSLSDQFQLDDHVIFLNRTGLWRDHALATAHQVLKIPGSIAPNQASMLSVNPPTAALLLEYFTPLKSGDYIAQNASNSGVGQALIQIANALGIHTINFVRRKELFHDLKALGANHVFVDDDNGFTAARETIEQPPTIAFNAVGGESALRLMDLLAPDGIHVTYGAMSRRSLKVPNKFLIFKNISLRGLWVTRWLEHASATEIENLLNPIAQLMLEAKLSLPVEKSYPPEKITAAIEHAQSQGRSGKILLDFSS